MRAPLEPGFMKSGFFSWPEREKVKVKCLDCKEILEVPINGKVRKRCPKCALERRRRTTKRWQKRYGSHKGK